MTGGNKTCTQEQGEEEDVLFHNIVRIHNFLFIVYIGIVMAFPGAETVHKVQA